MFDALVQVVAGAVLTVLLLAVASILAEGLSCAG